MNRKAGQKELCPCPVDNEDLNRHKVTTTTTSRTKVQQKTFKLLRIMSLIILKKKLKDHSLAKCGLLKLEIIYHSYV